MIGWPASVVRPQRKPGENAIDVANAVMTRVEALRNTVIPGDVMVAETRNYGASANDKAQKLITKLLFATASVVALVFLALGKREAAIVGSAIAASDGYYDTGYRRCGWVRQFDAYGNYIGRVRTCY